MGSGKIGVLRSGLVASTQQGSRWRGPWRGAKTVWMWTGNPWLRPVVTSESELPAGLTFRGYLRIAASGFDSFFATRRGGVWLDRGRGCYSRTAAVRPCWRHLLMRAKPRSSVRSTCLGAQSRRLQRWASPRQAVAASLKNLRCTTSQGRHRTAQHQSTRDSMQPFLLHNAGQVDGGAMFAAETG